MSEYDYNVHRKAMLEKAEAMTEEERKVHLEKPRNLLVKVHPTPYYYRDPYTGSFGSFKAYQKFRTDKGWDAPGLVWIKELVDGGEKFHDVGIEGSSGAVMQDCVTRGYTSINVQLSDDWMLAEMIQRITPAKVVMA